MRIIFIYFFCFLTPFVSIVEGSEARKPKCITCGTFAKYDTILNLKYCPYCVKKHQASWHYFIEFTKNKHKHVNESYVSQYTPLDFMIGIDPRLPLENYVEKIFIEFLNALWCKLTNKEYSFKNPDLQCLFFTLFEEVQEDDEKTLETEQDFNKLLQFYRELRWICLALYYECSTAENYTQYLRNVLNEINETIRFLLYYQK